MEFHHYALQIGVASFRDKVLEFIKVFIHRVTLLEISRGFQSVDSCWVCIDWTELPFEFISEVFPIDEFMVAYTAGTGWCFPQKNPFLDMFCDF